MEKTKRLSRDVFLCKNKEKYYIQRNLKKSAIKNVLQFYHEYDFKYRPELIQALKNGIKEKFIPGSHYPKEPKEKDIDSFSHTLHELHKNTLGHTEIKVYADKTYSNKINSLSLSEEQKLLLDTMYKQLRQLAPEGEVPLSWTHGDVKSDNIIHNSTGSYLIDWEWVKKGNFIQDLQKFISRSLLYDERLTDKTINLLYSKFSPPRKHFVRIEMLHFFLENCLQLSKGRIHYTELQKKMERKVTLVLNSNIAKVNTLGENIYFGNLWSESKLLYENAKQSGKVVPEIVTMNTSLDHQKLRLAVHKDLLLKNRNYLVLHGVVFQDSYGKNILIGGKSGSGKTYLYRKLHDLSLSKKLIDEDLIILKDKKLQPLTQYVYQGSSSEENKKHYYKKPEQESFGNLDMVFLMDREKSGFHKSVLNNHNLVSYLLHNKYDQKSIKEYYSQYNLSEYDDLPVYVVGNKTRINLPFIISTLCQKG